MYPRYDRPKTIHIHIKNRFCAMENWDNKLQCTIWSGALMPWALPPPFFTFKLLDFRFLWVKLSHVLTCCYFGFKEENKYFWRHLKFCLIIFRQSFFCWALFFYLSFHSCSLFCSDQVFWNNAMEKTCHNKKSKPWASKFCTIRVVLRLNQQKHFRGQCFT
jgi:hypothetical protein